MTADQIKNSQSLPNRHFATTQWSMVVAAAGADSPNSRKALAQLCETYWYPLYAYARRRVDNADVAQDLTQAFFACLLEQQTIAKADPNRGRFRAFLLTALQNFLTNEWEKARALKRGGGKPELSLDFDSGESRYQNEPAHDLTPEKLYERRWVLAILDQVLDCLKRELSEAGKAHYFEQFKGALTGETANDDYAQAADALGITQAAARQSAYRLRKRYRELFRQEVARTLSPDEDIDQEIGRLLQNLG